MSRKGAHAAEVPLSIKPWEKPHFWINAVSCCHYIHSDTGLWHFRIDDIGLGTYVSERVQVVVGQFQLLEGDELPHPVRARGWRVRVHVEPPGHGGLCLPGHGPGSQQHSRTVTLRNDTHKLSTGHAQKHWERWTVSVERKVNYATSFIVFRLLYYIFTILKLSRWISGIYEKWQKSTVPKAGWKTLS